MISVTLTNADALQQKLRSFANDLRNPRAFISLGQLISERAVRRNFHDARDVNGKAWPALKYRQGTPLVDKQGRMQKGITSRPEGTGWRVGAGSATSAFNAVHNFGSRLWLSGAMTKQTKTKAARPKGIPQRQYMYFSKAAITEIVANLKDYVRRQL